MSRESRAWMLDTMAFHHEFASLLESPLGLVPLRDRAARLWDSQDGMVREYLSLLTVRPADWSVSCDEDNLVDWYRVLMAGHLTPTRWLRSPATLRRGLPALGWHATEARRLSRGRELLTLAERHLSTANIELLLPRFGWGHKGWLDQSDIDGAIVKMRSLDRRMFRDCQDLVPVVEDAFEVFEAASRKPDHVLITLTS
ncbi:MAG: hypothetical protein KGR18_00610 [Acidobacteria bacterium]|nr:hypothetical protein [Acidobacteriota bacterium]